MRVSEALLWATMVVPGIEPASSGRVASALSSWAISLSIPYLLFTYLKKFKFGPLQNISGSRSFGDVMSGPLDGPGTAIHWSQRLCLCFSLRVLKSQRGYLKDRLNRGRWTESFQSVSRGHTGRKGGERVTGRAEESSREGRGCRTALSAKLSRWRHLLLLLGFRTWPSCASLC